MHGIMKNEQTKSSIFFGVRSTWKICSEKTMFERFMDIFSPRSASSLLLDAFKGKTKRSPIRV